MQATLALPSRIDEVVVYRHGALVTREAALPTETGGRVRLVGLPLSLDDTSVTARVAFEDDARELPSAVDCKVALERAPGDAALGPADDAALRDARREEAFARTAREQTEQEIARLDELAITMRPPPKPGTLPEPSPTDARLALITFRANEGDRLRRELEVRREAHRVAYERLKHREDIAQRASSARSPRETELRKSIVVALTGEAPLGARLRVSYLVPGARWVPSYVLVLDPALRQARIDVRALVYQRTGESWNDVRFTVSTALPQRFSELPELRSVRIGRAAPPARRTGFRPPPPGTSALFLDFDRIKGTPSVPPPPARPVADEEEFTPRDGVDASMYADETIARAPVAKAPQAPPSRTTLTTAAPVKAPMQYGAAGGAPPAPGAAPLGAVSMPSKGRVLREARKSTANLLAFPTPPQEIVAADSLLDYGALRLPEPGNPRRGRLIAATRLELYAELTSILVLERHTPALDANVLERLDSAVREAEREPALPAGTLYPAPAAFDHAYRSPVRATVDSDGALHTIPLLSDNAVARARYVAVPRESLDAFRLLELDSPFAVALLPGPIDVYVGGDYRATAELPATAPRGKVRLGLGVEPAIKIARNARFDEETTGLMRGTLDLRHDIRIDVVNHLSVAAELEVRERIPVAQENDDEVKVVLERSDPAAEPYPQEERPLRGGYVFRVSVAPREKRAITLVYVVRIPAKNELVGGNRREV